MAESEFEWDQVKNLENQLKHGVSFEEAIYAFQDPDLVLVLDEAHSNAEFRYFCFGLDKNKARVLSVRFTYRNNKIRIFGAGYWRKGAEIYEQEN